MLSNSNYLNETYYDVVSGDIKFVRIFGFSDCIDQDSCNNDKITNDFASGDLFF